jgi:predicted 2-oxoglutarate/Fe(II)-dependent dioxygenase YbiX
MNFNVVISDFVFTVDNFFTPEECRQHIESSESKGYGDAPINTFFGAAVDKSVRNNTRVMFDDQTLADALWKRIEPFVLSPIKGRNAVGLNERIRYYRYEAGHVFRPHYDGSFERDNGERSQLTFMVYLNEDFEGGATRFHLPYEGETSVIPKTGTALLFIHQLRHEGAMVHTGRKYVLRSDIMFSAL